LGLVSGELLAVRVGFRAPLPGGVLVAFRLLRPLLCELLQVLALGIVRRGLRALPIALGNLARTRRTLVERRRPGFGGLDACLRLLEARARARRRSAEPGVLRVALACRLVGGAGFAAPR